MEVENFDNEKKRILGIFEQLPKKKQNELLSSEDLLRSWITEEVNATTNPFSMYNIVHWALQGLFTKPLSEIRGLTGVTNAIADYIKEKKRSR